MIEFRHAAAIILAAGIAIRAPSLLAQPGESRSPLMAKHLVEIGRGRRINMVCSGHGAPAVVFEYGMGGHLLNWKTVEPAMSALTTTCFYDRAGYGYSGPTSQPMTAENVTNDLYWLLRKAGVERPIVLVGHSLGGLYATLYADRFPADVAGLVLIDPSFAGQDLDETSEEQARAQAAFDRSRAWIQNCETLARGHLLSVRNPAGCIPFASDNTAAERDWLVEQFSNSTRWETMLQESRNLHTAGALSEDEQEEQRAAGAFGEKPLTVFTAGIAPEPADETDAEHLKNLAHWKAGHDRLAARSSRGESTIVPNATHMIQLDQPKVVIDAIKKVVLQLRAEIRRPD